MELLVTQDRRFADVSQTAQFFVLNDPPNDPWMDAVEAGLLRTVVLRGELERDRCTLHHPRTFAGITAYATRTKVIRDLLRPRRWQPHCANNIESVQSPNGHHAIVTMAGNEHTGRNTGLRPLPQNEKGNAIRAAIQCNRQLRMLVPAAPDPVAAPLLMWFLMVYRVEEMVCSELSLPWRYDDSNAAVDGWICRYLLDPIDLSDTPPSRDVNDPTDEIDIPVRRRA